MDTPLVYLGTPEEAVPPLRALHAAGYNIVLVITRADARRGRRGKETPSPVKAASLELGIPVAHDLDAIAASDAALGVVVAYGRIIPAAVLDAVPMLNIHFSKLPRWRGAAPVERAILAGDTETAVGIMQMEAGLDTGPLHAEQIVPIHPDDTAETLRSRLVSAGTELLIETLAGGLDAAPRPQEGTSVYASKISSDDRAIDWSQPGVIVDRVIRVGRAHTTFRGERFIVWQANLLEGEGSTDTPGALRTGEKYPVARAATGELQLIEVQPAGKARMDAASWWNGAQADGEVLGQ